MATLYVLRHAKSSWTEPLPADHDRPLAPRGRRNAAALAEHVRGAAVAPEFVLCSTAVRARETLGLVLASLAGETEIRLENGLYAATADSLAARLRTVPEGVASVLLVGHNPGLEDLVRALAGRDAPERLPTAAFVEVAVGGPWRRLDEAPCRIVSVTVPR